MACPLLSRTSLRSSCNGGDAEERIRRHMLSLEDLARVFPKKVCLHPGEQAPFRSRWSESCHCAVALTRFPSGEMMAQGQDQARSTLLKLDGPAPHEQMLIAQKRWDNGG